MEVKSLSVETSAPDRLFPRLCLELEKLGYRDIHMKALESVHRNLKDMLNVDLMKRASFKRSVNTPRPHVFINEKTNGVVVLNEPKEEEFVTGKIAFEVNCFSKTDSESEKLAQTIKNLLVQSGLRKDAIYSGDFNENCDKHFIKGISGTSRSSLIKQLNARIINSFAQFHPKKSLRRLTTLPMKFFSRDMFKFFEEDTVYEYDPDNLKSFGIVEEKFALECKTCEPSFSTGTPIFDSEKDASSALQKESLLCAKCGNRLTSNSATIQGFFRFTGLGLECAKGLWLEGYVKLILEELGIKGDMIKCCAVHGKDELDLVFTYCGELFICECRDRVVGRNDVYVLAMKASRINDAEETDAIVSKVWMVSTEAISKDIVLASRARKEDEEPDYVFITGDSETIKKQIIREIKNAKQRYKRAKIKQLSQKILDCLPATGEEIRRRFTEEEEFFY